MPSTPPELKLDPGPQPRRRSKLSCRCILWTFAAVVGLVSSYFGYLAVRGVVNWFRAPHSYQFQDLTAPYKPSEVVLPLVDSNQTFDIVATVWVRQNNLDSPLSTLNQTNGPRLVEEAIYSDTIFRGVHLKDKNVRTAVNFSLPTEIFKSAELWNYDLRASFVLVPNPPSPLTFAVNYSSWIPPAIYYPPMRPWTADEDRTLADEIVDSYGLLVPLLEFHPITSKCEESSEAAAQDTTEFEDDDNWDAQAFVPKIEEPLNPDYKSTKGKSVLAAHPYVVTRTHIRVLDMTKIKNRKAYDSAHRSLALKSCAQDKLFVAASWRKCQKAFLQNGNMETRIKLRISNATEWAYAPYMDFSSTASGPLDLIPVPVNREECRKTFSEDETRLQPPDKQDENGFMNITWNIAFSGRTPAKLIASNAFAGPLLEGNRDMNVNITEYNMHTNQAQHEFISGLFGYRFDDDAHPRLLFFAYALGFQFSVAERILDFIYWYTRSSTVGISINGTALLIFGILTGFLLEIARQGYESGNGFLDWIMIALYDIPTNISAIPMLMAITRAELRREPKAWIPTLSFSSATHTERASQRVDARTPRSYILMAYAGLALVFLICSQFAIYIVSSEGMSPPPPAKAINMAFMLDSLLRLPSTTIGRLLQIILNFRSKTFAGAYRLGPWFLFFASAVLLVVSIPDLFGRSTIKSGLYLFNATEFLLTGILAWQAVIYPLVSQKEDSTVE